MTERVVLLTGATGRIGAAVARSVLQAGSKVAATVRRPWQVQRLRDELGEERLLVGLVPPRDAEAAAGFVKGANDALGPITCLVCAAGSLRPRDPGVEPAGDLDELLEANLLLNATVVRAVLPFLRRRATGSLCFVGMPADPSGFSVTTLASKAALQGFVAGIQRETAGTGLRVALVAPPVDDTSIGEVVGLLLGITPTPRSGLAQP